MAITFDVLDRFQESKVSQTAQTMNNIISTRESYPQYPWVILDSFEQVSEIMCSKLVTKYQNDSKAEFTGSPSETGSDSDSTEETEGEDKLSASSVISLIN